MNKRSSGLFVLLVLAITVLLLIWVFPISTDGLGCRLTTTTSVYATLITILLALLALAITAYIFLATSLKERRESYEQETIDRMLSLRTTQLLYLTGGGLFSLFACFLLDNGDYHIPYENVCLLAVIIVSTAVSVLLLVYIGCIINFENGLLSVAKRARKKLFPSGKFWKKIPLDMSIFKLVGDLEMLVMQLLHNHKDDFHNIDVLNTLQVLTTEEFVKTYKKLISYRDFLRVEKQENRSKLLTTDEEQRQVMKAVRQLEDDLKDKRLGGERLKNLNFIAPFLRQDEQKFKLEATVFTGSAFEKINFKNASLQSADFSQARLNCVNLEDADCTEAVFSEAVFRELTVNSRSKFEKAVFRDTAFGRQKFCADIGEVFRFQNASFVKANLIECVFQACDFRYANFSEALMASIELDSVCLSYADLNQAILTNAKLQFQPTRVASFPVKDYWNKSQLRKDGQPHPSYANSWNGHGLGAAFFVNLERSTLSQACLANYNFAVSRMAGANFSDTSIENCIFDRCYGQRATFQEAVIKECRFWFAMFNLVDLSYSHIFQCDFSNVDLRNSLIVEATVKNSTFKQANFTNAQLRGCLFSNCNFTGARFIDADLTGACFQNCTLTEAKFDGTDRGTYRVEHCIGYQDKLEEGTAESEAPAKEEGERSLAVEQVIQERKSTRSFHKSRAMEREQVDRFLHAALQAPSPKNRQPWMFMAVMDKAKQEELARILEEKLESLRFSRLKQGKGVEDLDLAKGSVRVLRDASALIFTSYIRDEQNEHGDSHNWTLGAYPFEAADLQSIGAAIENLLLGATASGVDSLWMCDVLYAYQEYMDCLHLKGPLVACIALGYQTPHHAPRVPLEKKVEYWS